MSAQDVADAVAALGWVVLVGALVLNTVVLALALLAVAELTGYRRRSEYAVYHEDFGDPLARGVSLVLPLRHAGADPVTAVWALLTLRYPDFEVVLVDDGDGPDGPVDDVVRAALTRDFGLVETPIVVPGRVPYVGPVRQTLTGRTDNPRLLLVRKDAGTVADALNAGLDVARKELVGRVGDGVVLDPEALFHVARPFADDPETVVAAAGIVLGLNGCTVQGGRVVVTAAPRSWWARLQAVEHLREHVLLRAGWSAIGGLAQVSTAFSVVRRDLLVSVRGWRDELVDEDSDLALRLLRRRRDVLAPARAVLVSEPVAWVPVPETRAGLADLRTRHVRCLARAMARHHGMLGRPRYGVTGMLALPWLVLMSLVGPVLDLALLVFAGAETVVLAGTASGVWSIDGTGRLLLLVLAAAVVYPALLAVGALIVDEVAYRRHRTTRDVAASALAALVESVWFHSLAGRRLVGTWRGLREAQPPGGLVP